MLSLAVFGSVARQTPRPDSDLDFLVVATNLPRGRMARVAEFEEVERRMEEALAQAEHHGVHTFLSPVFKTPEELPWGSLLFWDMTEEAVILYDPKGILSRHLAAVRERLASLGARRIVRGTTRYWDLKPDYKPGEVFEL
ncbi:MAG: nucleotidyltransferase domain-containing protein [Thermoanaerobaculum sp.]